MTRVLVIGGGVAGYCAALAARREGAEVTMVARAPGATALYSGAMSVVGDIEQVLNSEPHHPFTRLGLGAPVLSGELDLAVANLRLALEKEGLALNGDWRTSGRYSDIHGLAQSANLVPATVSGGELGALYGRRLAVVGVTQIGDYDAGSTAQALRELHAVDAFAHEVSMPELPLAASITDLYGRRAPSMPLSRPAAVAYPPGFTHLPDGSFELLASPPSPHGWRLQQAIALGSHQASVIGFEVADGRIVAARSKDRAYAADAFVLATGRHIGGGLRGGRTMHEPLLELPLFFDGRPVADQMTRLQHLTYLDPESMLRSGLATDARLHPLGTTGAPPYTNLYAAGAVLGGYEYAGACGFGVPILTGWLAGRWAARP